MSVHAIDMKGMRFGSLVAIGSTGRRSGANNLIWLFVCDCGNECEVDGYDVRSGKRSQCLECSARNAGLSRATHGMSESPEYHAWTEMKTRCDNPKRPSFKNYGGRGISICQEWRDSFQAFFNYMGERPGPKYSLDRIDNNGNYEPGNCRWATTKEQSYNRRTNVHITINGQTHPASYWAEVCGITMAGMLARYHAGRRGADLLAPSKQKGSIMFRGQLDTFDGWSKRTGIKPSTIAMRIHTCGWPVEKALTLGATKCV